MAACLLAALAVLHGLLGNIHQAEVQVEGADHVRQVIGLEVLGDPGQPLAQGRVFLLAQADVAAAQGFHGGKNRFTGLFAQHLAQQVAKQADTAAQLLVGCGVVTGVLSLRHMHKKTTLWRGILFR